MALHELATNAAKYGALATENGRLAVRWRVEPHPGERTPHLHVGWREAGVVMPPDGAPARGGASGRELIERALPCQLDAETTFELGPGRRALHRRCAGRPPARPAWRGEA